MKLALPIQISAIPDPSQSPELWRRVAPILSAIAAKEKHDESLYPYEKVAYNAIAFAQYNASKKQWGTLWQYLLDRQVLQVGEVATPPPRKLKSDRPTKPPKSKRRKPKKKSSSLIRLEALMWVCGWIAFSEPLCHKERAFRIPLRDRPKCERIKALLDVEAKGRSLKLYMPSTKARYKMHPNVKDLLTNWSDNRRHKGERIKALLSAPNLRIYLPSTKSSYKMHPNVIATLLKWSNPRRKRSQARIDAERKKGVDRRYVSRDELNQALTDKWQDSGAIAVKLNKILGTAYPFAQISNLLSNRYAAGEIYRLNRDCREITYYSLIEATKFENQWLTLDTAYRIAQSRGCTVAKNTFRKHHKFDYASVGLEFRKEVPEPENIRLRWRDIRDEQIND